jgi:hypothetical protein
MVKLKFPSESSQAKVPKRMIPSEISQTKDPKRKLSSEGSQTKDDNQCYEKILVMKKILALLCFTL